MVVQYSSGYPFDLCASALQQWARFLHRLRLLARISLERPLAIRNFIIRCHVQSLELSPHVCHNLRQVLKINILSAAQETPPKRSCENGVTLHETLIVGEKHTSPLREHVFQGLLAQRVGIELVPHHQAIFGSVESVVREVLDPDGSVGLGEHAEAHLQHPHVDKCYLSPIGEVWLEAKCCAMLVCVWFTHGEAVHTLIPPSFAHA